MREAPLQVLWKFLVLACTALLLSTAVATPPSGDAGSGSDAGDTIATATPLPGPGYYRAALDPAGESDWFSLAAEDAASSAQCVRLRVGGDFLANATLGLVSRGELKAASTTFAPLQATKASLALPGVSHVYVGVGPHDSAPSLASGDYWFDLSVYGHRDLGFSDAGTGTDAGDTIATAIVPTQSCVKGKLNPSAGDQVDLYALEAMAGERLVYSVGAGTSDVTVDLIDPDGVAVATASSGDILDLTLEKTGTWNLAASDASGGSTTYVIGLIGPGEDPEPNPCRPTCAN